MDIFGVDIILPTEFDIISFSKKRNNHKEPSFAIYPHKHREKAVYTFKLQLCVSYFTFVNSTSGQNLYVY